ncbi:MAG: SLC13 family permease [candidate division KSB1 bacterium]|nr:SLC13 family permease [candidate division KSB1 bacterium]
MTETNTKLTGKQLLIRGLVMIMLSGLAGFLAHFAGLNTGKMILATSIFVLIISATLMFWNFRLAIAFIGIAVLLGGKVMSLEQMIESAELDIILFLIGMMCLVGVLKDLGLFSWIIQMVVSMKKINGLRFTIILVFISAIMACFVDEVTSIVFVLALVFQVCDTLKIRPTPFVIIAVMATNIGSSGTMLGNPVGILIGTKAGFSFKDFIIWATPVMLLTVTVTLFILLFIYRKEIHLLTERLEARRQAHLGLGPLVKIPYGRGLAILIGALSLIAMHYKIEAWLGVEKNTILIVAPLTISGILMIWRNERARHYIESEVEWWTLLFFMMLFSVAGSLEYTGVTAQIAHDFRGLFGNNPTLLTPFITFISAIGSAFVDNIVFVAAFVPIVKELGYTQLWWALLFGATLGGNITAIGSTANIVALGMLEKRYHSHISFWEWLKVGLIVGLVTCTLACIAVLILAPYMPAHMGH